MILISLENQVVLKKRLQSFLWRAAGQVVALGLAFAAENLNLFELPPVAIVALGLIISELTKQLNKR